ncbi:MAG TPA: winged helix-turn-helix domain-containing protein, partial [Thermomicrobiales bacterium]|nr:winged helix-turn-helix domain-containing protein [Thermomicrobiales bacterium]
TRGPLRIEPDRYRAVVGTEPLRLRPKEFGLLFTLAWEPEKVFSRQRLLDEIWGQDVVVDPRTVDVHVSWLRAKLMKGGLPSETIRTIHGVGYCFTDPDQLDAPDLAAPFSP